MRGIKNSSPPCRAEGCDRVSYDIGLCNMHALRWRRNGTLGLKIKRTRANGTGTIAWTGYLVFLRDGKRVGGHRIAWEKERGPIPRGMVVHHRDGNKLNNAIGNLELLTAADHVRLHNPAKRRTA